MSQVNTPLIDLESDDNDKYKYLIDKACPDKFVNKVHIHVVDRQLMWCTLNQTDLESNSNKYYVMQLLKHDVMNSYFLVIRSGRVGSESKKDFKCYLDPKKTLDEFHRIFYEKTGHVWDQRFTMSKKDGKYDFVDMEIDNKKQPQPQFQSLEKLENQLDPLIEILISTIFDTKMFEATMKTFKIDTEKAPLGKISVNQINKAYSILTQIQELIKNGTPDNDKQYLSLSSTYYTNIPTSFGNQKLPPIVTEKQIKDKIDLLAVLGEMAVMGNIMAKISLGSSKTWQQYQSLNTKLTHVDDSSVINRIKKYVDQTKGSTHNMYLNIRHIYETERNGEASRFEKSKSYGNRQLLWHGSRLSNYVGILNQGLRIAPPEAPSTGYMFGKGIYFANAVTKSAQYMHAENGVGIILLCEVVLGTPYQKKTSEYVNKLPDGYHSTWGVGQWTPDIEETTILDDGLIVPLGKLKQSNRKGLSLMYDEYIVYDVSQVKIKYVIMLDVK